MHSAGTRRTRLRWLMPLLGGFLLVATGCAGYETDPGVAEQAPSSSLQDVTTKIDYMKQDRCFKAPMQHGSARCDRYLEQVKNIASVSTGVTASPPVRQAGYELGDRIQHLMSQNCLPPRAGSEHQCATSLAAVDQGMVDLDNEVAASEQPPR